MLRPRSWLRWILNSPAALLLLASIVSPPELMAQRLPVSADRAWPVDETERFLTSSSPVPIWSELNGFATIPSKRGYHDAIYDAPRDRMVVFGGFYGGYKNDVWALSLTGGSDWIELFPAGIAPGPRAYHTTVYDPIGERMIVFGGSGSSLRNDVWALSLAGSPEWIPLYPSGTPPSPRGLHSAVFDPVGDRMIVFGGWDNSYRSDVWELSFAGSPAWNEITPFGSAPTGRSGHASAYDWVRGRLIVFGGFDSAYRNDVWALPLTGEPEWTEITPTGTPPSTRAGSSGIYDPMRDRFVLFGGWGPYKNDVWAVSLSGQISWTELLPDGTKPIPRYHHSAIYDPLRDRMVVFGGEGPEDEYIGYFDDTWELAWGSTVDAGNSESVPGIAMLRRVFPNPSSQDQTFELALDTEHSALALQVLDTRGRLVWDTGLSHLGPGLHNVRWDGRDHHGALVGPSVYFVRVLMEGAPEQRRVVRIR